MNLDGLFPDRVALDAWGTICGLAAETSTLRLGTMVSPATFRHPSNLAKLAVTADQISGGRIELGLGAGWHGREHAAYGFPFADTRTRMDVLEEQLQVVLGSWGSDTFSHHGTHYGLEDLIAQPKPVQRPHPPLIMGGSGGPRSVRLAATYADEYNTPFPSLEDVRERKALVDAACEQAGRNPIPFSVMTGVAVGSDPAEAERRLRARAEKMGTDPGPILDDPPPDWITGTVDQAAEQLLALREAGVSRVMCQHFVHDDLDMVTLIGEELAPRVA
jgi:alkanesulfonate monooxygenase SsuD/methylene tetrahydromethanopterin reductase-like flavin-dependent oxidoreductase (luciferase family)